MSTSSQRPFRASGGFAGVSHDTHERPGQEWRATESDNANTLALRTNGEEHASGGRHPAENDYDPLQSPYPPKEEPAPPRIEENFAAEATAGQQELVRSVQREEAAARLPRAAQLPSVLGLAPGDEGLWPARSLEPEYRDNLRGPRTIIKTIFLIVSIFTVPMAYYFWMGGWDTISGAPPPEVASFNSRPFIPPPKPSSEEETTTVRGGDPGTPAKGERRTAKSSAGETVAMLQPGTPSAQASPSSPAVRALDAEQIKLLMKRGEQFIAAGDVVTARTAFQRAAEAGDAKAAVALGATYDPTVLAKLGVVGISADVAKARSWYEKAEKLGSPDARRRLEVLADR